MDNKLCRYGRREQRGMQKFIFCIKNNFPCAFQRYCQTSKRAIHTSGWNTCLGLRENKKNDKE